MKTALFYWLSAALLFAAPIKVAFLGDSITDGGGAEPKDTHRYAARAAGFLGEGYEAEAFGASSLCILRKADLPLIETPQFKEALAFKPDVAVVVLGTNDTMQTDRRTNWDHHSELREDALFLVEKLREVNPEVLVHLCSPPPMFPNQPGLKPKRKQGLAARSPRFQIIRSAYAMVAEGDAKVFYHDLSRSLLPGQTTDGVHPNNAGHEFLGRHIAEIIRMPRDGEVQEFPEKKSEWHGFKRSDFELPTSRASAIVVQPHTVRKGRPWIWRARFWGHQPALDLALLDRGYHVAYVDVGNLFGSEEAMKRGAEMHKLMTEKYHLDQTPILEGMSRGGLFVFNFAAQNPKKVSAVYGDNPVCNFNSWPGGKNGKFSKRDWSRCLQAYGISAEEAPDFPQISDRDFAPKLRRIPVALVIGTNDKVVPPSQNGEALAANLKEIDSPHRVWRKPGLGHHPHGLDPVDPLLRFLLKADQNVVPIAK